MIDPKGKSTAEIQQEIIDYMDDATSAAGSGLKVSVRVGHFPSVIQNARAFAHQGEYEVSCLFYAVWFEHWLNHMIYMSGLRRSLNDKEIQEILRHAKFESKATWILRVLGVKPIAETHLRRMQRVTQIRNAFVYYKWKAEDMDTKDSEKREHDLKLLVENIEVTISYLRRLESQQVLGGRKRAILARFKFGDTWDTEELPAPISTADLRN